ncbi:MAG: TonB family protein [Myxococcales bacterium]|nr:TonB family protein [Myxococcales bacterium]
MSEAVTDLRRDKSALWLLATLGVSMAVHGGALAALGVRRSEGGKAQKPVELVMVEVEPPKPPPPPKEEPKPEPAKKPPPIQVAQPPKPPEPPKEETPPPPNEAPPPEPPKPVPLVVGVTMSSTTSAGSFAAPVGNTLYGKTAEKAADPTEVKPYSAPKYTPIYQVDSEPRVTHEVKVPYPEEARRAGIEGSVVLSLVIDPEGKVLSVKVLSGPGYGLNEAAREAMKRFKWRPAYKGGEAVSTEMKYTYTFTLD